MLQYDASQVRIFQLCSEIYLELSLYSPFSVTSLGSSPHIPEALSADNHHK